MQGRIVIAAALAAAACGAKAPAKPEVVHNEAKQAVPGVDPDVACAALQPEAANPVLGRMPRRAVPLVGQAIDGSTFDLAQLHGRAVLVSFQASWDGLTKEEQPTFPELAAALGKDLAIVRVSSDNSIDVTRASVPADAPYTTVFDQYRDQCSALGELTYAWGVRAVPESYLVDRAGNVRFYFVNKRDWSTPEAIACARAVAADPMPAITAEPEVTGPPLTCDVMPEPMTPQVAPDPNHYLRGTIRFGKPTKGRAKAGTSIFLLAKRVDASGAPTGIPLAITKLVSTGKAQPFELTEADNLVATDPLVGDVVIIARYDQDDDAITKQEGDLVGQVRATVPADKIDLVIDTVLPKP